jgi:hypothetical protein
MLHLLEVQGRNAPVDCVGGACGQNQLSCGKLDIALILDHGHHGGLNPGTVSFQSPYWLPELFTAFSGSG